MCTHDKHSVHGLTTATFSIGRCIHSSSIYTGPSLHPPTPLNFSLLHPQIKCYSPSVAPISIPIVYPPATCTLDFHISQCRATALAVRHNGPSPWQPLAAGVRGLSWQAAQLGSAPPLPPPSSHSTKAGISLSSHLLHSSLL